MFATTNVRLPMVRRTAWTIRRSFAHAARTAGVRPSARPSRARKRCGLSGSTWRSIRRIRDDSHSAFPWPANAERISPWFGAVSSRPTAAPNGGRAATSPIAKRPRAQAGTSCTQRTSGSSAVARAIISSRNARRCGGQVLPWNRFQLRTSTAHYATSVRVLLADPPAFTPWYDHELAAALARGGVEVEVATSRFRFGDSPVPSGYSRSERYYPLSSRLFRRSPLRLPLKAVEHLAVVADLSRVRPDVLHAQWLPFPQFDSLLRFRAPAVFTAHDLLPDRK